MLKRLIQALLPARAVTALRLRYRDLRDRVRLWQAFRYDQRFYATGSGLRRQCSHRPSLEAGLIKAYHRIEKGLALQAPRPGFGRDAVDKLLVDGARYLRLFGPHPTLQRVVNTLDEYMAFNRKHGVPLDELQAPLDRLRGGIATLPPCDAGGSVEVSRDAIHAASCRDLRDFFASRHSVRQFTGEPVEAGAIADAVRMAQKTPSVCNRESGTVYAAFDPVRCAQLLAHQNGNRGFGDRAGCVLVITSRLDTFLTVGERYQGWIDGGMFAMSLVYALHSFGLGTCCLNWSVEPAADLALRRDSGIPADQAVIMMLAVGHLPARLRVAQSPRRAVEEVLRTL